MSVNARKEKYEHIELFGKPALFTNSRIDRTTVPEGFYCYDLRGSDYDPGRPMTIEKQVAVNHAGAVLTPEPVTIPKEGFRRLRGNINFLGESLTLADFCEEHKITLAPEFSNPDESGMKMGGITPMYIYPDNLKSKATLWLWELRDIGIIGIGCLISVFALSRLGWLPPIVITAVYAFLSIRFEDVSILDFIRYAVAFFFGKQQTYEWGA